MSEAAVPPVTRGRLGAARLLSDDRLARRAAKGEETAFAAIFDRYHQDLYRFCLAIVGNPTDAQDALQNTMVKVLRALPGEERRVELKPWLYRIAHNESVEVLRRRRPIEELDPELATRGGDPAEDAESRGRLRQLLVDLERLPERQRAALVMRELGGLGFEEIATALTTSPATARQTLYEARQSLRQMDEGREMDCDAVTRALSDADGRVTRRRDIRAHLRACPDCRRFREEIEGRRADLGALAPLPAVAAAGLLQGLLGGAATSSGAGAGAGLAGAAAGGAAKSLGAGAAIKSAVAVAAVAALGAGAADRGGVVDVTPWGGGGSQREAPDHKVGNAAATGATPALDAALSTRRAAPADGEKGGNGRATDTVGVGALVGAANGAIPTAGSESQPAGAHPHGRGHEKHHPESASDGQQTAAGHAATGKGVGQGRGGGADKEKATRQPKAPKPAKSQPKKPAQPKKSSQAEPSGGGAVVVPPKAPTNPGAPHPSPSPQGEAKESPHSAEGDPPA